MVFFPLLFLLLFLAGLLSFGLFGFGAYLVIGWILGTLVGWLPLIAGAAMLLFTIAGRPLVLLLLRRPGRDEPRPARSELVQRIKRADGSEIQVELYGPADGQPIILSHGWGTDSTEWYYVKRALGDRFRLIVWDIPGLGQSRRPDKHNYKTEKLASDLEAVLGLAGDKPAILVGHSAGSMLTLTFCRLFPQHLGRRVAGVVLSHATYINPVKTATFCGFLSAIQKPILEPLLHVTTWLSPVFWLMNWMSYYNGTNHIVSALVGFAGKETRGQLDYGARFTPMASPAVLAQGMLDLFDYDERATLANIDVPVLVIAGDLDRLTNPDAGALISREVPRGELMVLGPAGHMSMFEQHERFNENLEAFANRVAQHAQHTTGPQTRVLAG